MIDRRNFLSLTLSLAVVPALAVLPARAAEPVLGDDGLHKQE